VLDPPADAGGTDSQQPPVATNWTLAYYESIEVAGLIKGSQRHEQRQRLREAVSREMFDFKDKTGLFDNFEVNHEPFWPRVKWLLAGSLAWHAIFVTCILLIPPVRDALSIAFIFSGGRIVDRPYSKTNILNQGDILEVTAEKFHYPEGYFAMDQQPMPSPLPAGPAFRPRPFSPSSEAAAASPSPAASVVPSPSPLIVAKASPSPSIDPKEAEATKKAEEQLDRVAAENGVKRPKEINTRPFKDLLASAKKMKDDGKLNLSGQIELTVEADRDAEGKLQNAKVTDKRGDKTLEGVALDFVSALSDSGVLDFLEGTKHLKLVAKVDDNNIEIVVSTEVESEERARQLEKGYSLLIVGGRIVKRGKDEEIYYNHTEVTSHDKEVSVKLAMPRSELSPLLLKYSAAK